jgi:hypothetical protein
MLAIDLMLTAIAHLVPMEMGIVQQIPGTQSAALNKWPIGPSAKARDFH